MPLSKQGLVGVQPIKQRGVFFAAAQCIHGAKILRLHGLRDSTCGAEVSTNSVPTPESMSTYGT